MILIATLLALFFVWLARQRTKRYRRVAPSLAALDETEKKARIRDALGLYGLIEKPLTVAMIPLFVALVIGLSTIPRWIQVRDSLQMRGVSIAEGPVQSAKRWLARGSGTSPSTVKYELQVNGKTFRWQGDQNAWHDNLVRDKSGVFQAGKRVRVSYVSIESGDELLRIEAENTCELFLKCSGFTIFGWRWESKR